MVVFKKGRQANKEELVNAFVLLLSGIVDMKNKKEMWMQDKNKNYCTIEFYDMKPLNAIIRRYWKNGNIFSEMKVKNAKLLTVKWWGYQGRQYTNEKAIRLSVFDRYLKYHAKIKTQH